MTTRGDGGWRPGGRAALGSLLWGCVAIALAMLLGGRHPGDDAVVLLTCALKLGGGRRAAAGLLAAVAAASAFPPLCLPLSWAWGIPLVWLWRRRDDAAGAWINEAFWIGFTLCWLASPFVRADYGGLGVAVHALAGALFGLQMIGIAAVLRGTRLRPPLAASLATAAAATAAELVRVFLLGWPLLLLSSPAASTPMAQWARAVSPFGVSFLLYLLNFSLLPTGAGRRRWAAPALAVALAVVAWVGGRAIGDRVRFDPPPARFLLVQPHLPVTPLAEDAGPAIALARRLDRLTRDALATGPRPDLIVWPETSIARPRPIGDDPRAGGDATPTLRWVADALVPAYGAACLVGAVVREPDGRLFNSACLLMPGGVLSRYDKRRLVPGAESGYTTGETPRVLSLTTRSGARVRLALAICYEMHFPRWPRFRAGGEADLTIILNNESAYRHYPGMHRYGTWACQYRAIESRTWQLVAASWSRSALIDPAGRVRAILPDGAGALFAGPGLIAARPAGGDGPAPVTPTTRGRP